MINLTIQYISISSLFSLSPLLTSNSVIANNFKFKRYIAQSIFYNQKNLLLEKSTFIKGIGNIILLDSTKTILSNNIDERHHDEIFPQEGKEKYILYNDDILKDIFYKAIIIRDCQFIANNVGQNLPMIKIEGSPSFYMTSCLFDSCYAYNSIINIKIKSTVISHICCYNITKYEKVNNKVLFLDSEVREKTFFQFIFSSLLGNNQDQEQTSIFKTRGQCPVRYQCMNLTNFKNSQTNSDSNIIDIRQSSCINMLMNTFSNLQSETDILYFNPHNLYPGFRHFIGNTNFIDNSYKNGLIYFDIQDNTHVYCHNCIFHDNKDINFFYSNYYETSENKGCDIIFDSCSFSRSNNNLQNYFQFISDKPNDAPTLELDHFYTANVCPGKLNGNAYGCQNYSCINDYGCVEDNYSFGEGVATYTLKHHEDIDTPTPSPSDYFSQSFLFSFSKQFSNSKYFTESNDFSKSTAFSNSIYFSETEDFTRSTIFSESKKFTKSNDFSDSTFFSNSKCFTGTTDFTKSTDFTKTNDFTKTTDFTYSKHFSETSDFTISTNFSNSKDFTNSFVFSSSFYFSKTSIFSETGKFSNTDDFTFSIVFTNSNNFTDSDNLNKSSHFTQSIIFTDSNQFSSSIFFSYSKKFTETDEFSKSVFFSESKFFTKTNDFTKSFIFSDSQSFTDPYATFNFSNSQHFSKSEVFSKSAFFSQSKRFSSSNHFSQSNEFQCSQTFIESESFSLSKTLIDKSLVVINIKKEETNNISTGVKVGIGIACAALVVTAILIGLFLLRRRKLPSIDDLDNETIEIAEDTTNSFVHANPLINLMSDDDPFDEEFK